MTKKREQKMWALWNYRRCMGVERTRKRAMEYAALLCLDGKPEADRMFREGSYIITKVSVHEI